MTKACRTLVALALSAGALMIVAQVAAAQSTYVALGDSYASGDGTGVYYNDGTSCYRSPDAYAPLIAAAKGYALSFEACSGATTSTVISSQLGTLNASTSLVTIQIGGNDVGFTNVMENCALYYFTCESAISKAESEAENQLPAALNTTYADVRAGAPNAKVVVLGYPHLFDANGDTCGFNLLTSSHAKSLNGAADILDGVIKSAATAHGFTFVDPRTAFSTHELCQSNSWLNNDTLPIQKSYHPTIAGEADFATLIEGSL